MKKKKLLFLCVFALLFFISCNNTDEKTDITKKEKQTNTKSESKTEQKWAQTDEPFSKEYVEKVYKEINFSSYSEEDQKLIHRAVRGDSKSIETFMYCFLLFPDNLETARPKAGLPIHMAYLKANNLPISATSSSGNDIKYLRQCYDTPDLDLKEFKKKYNIHKTKEDETIGFFVLQLAE